VIEVDGVVTAGLGMLGTIAASVLAATIGWKH
jgi:hypothetical protein